MPGRYQYTLVNPVTVQRMDEDGRLIDSIQAVRENTSGRLCASNSFPQSTWVRWTRNFYNDQGQLVAVRSYHTIPAGGVETGTQLVYDFLSFQY